MTKIDGEHLVTDDPSVAVLFWGKEIDCQSKLFNGTWEEWDAEAWSTWSWVMVHIVIGKARIRIPRALVRDAIEPVEGETNVYLDDMVDIEIEQDYSSDGHIDNDRWHYRAFYIYQTYHELSKLTEWAREKDK